MAHAKTHDYHILPPSIWPFLGAFTGFVMLLGGVLYMHSITPWVFWAGVVGVLYTMYGWWADVVRESRTSDHTPVVRIGLRYGMILFIASEVMFFAAWFWSFFKHALYPMWTYPGTEYEQPEIFAVDAFHLPLINTLVLLLSGCAVTWAHHALAHENDRRGLITGLAIAIVLGIAFTGLQAYEYGELLLHHGWTFGGGEYFSNFFMITGFHGFHVIVGTIFLAVCLVRAIKGDFTPERHIGLEAAAWYWHFVDVVWLFLFFSIYIWASAMLT